MYSDELDSRLLDRRSHVAHKEYACIHGDTIKPGERYEKEIVLIDGDFHEYKMHSQFEYDYEKDEK